MIIILRNLNQNNFVSMKTSVNNSINFEQLQEPDIEKLFSLDDYLRLHEKEIRRRYGEFFKLIQQIEQNECK